MAEKYIIHRSNDYDLRYQISQGLNSLSERLGGPDDPVGPPAYDGNNMRWRNEWVQQQYYQGDTVRDDAWLMVANKDTTDRAAPQPSNAPQWTLPDAPVWVPLQYTGHVYSGMEFTVPADTIYVVTGVRVWIPTVTADAKYRVVIYNIGQGTWSFGQPFTGDVLTAPGWLDVKVASNLLGAGAHFAVVVDSLNTAGTTDFNHPWQYMGDDKDSIPLTGELYRDKDKNLRFNRFDDDAVDRTAELDSLTVSTRVRVVEEGNPSNFREYELTSEATITGDEYLYTSQKITDGGGGNNLPGADYRCQVYFEIPIAAPTDYVELTNYYSAYPQVSGYISFDEVEGGTNNQNAYGIDVQFQHYTESPDWDAAAYSAGVVTEGADASNNRSLPTGGGTGEVLGKLSGTPFDIGWIPAGGGGGGLTSYASFHLGIGGLTGVSNTAQTLVINATGINTGEYTLAGNEVTIDTAGDYEINAFCYFNISNTSRSEFTMWLEVDGAEVAGTRSGIYTRGYDSGSTGTLNKIMAIAAAGVVRLRIQRTDGGSTQGYQDDNGTGLTIKRLDAQQ